MAEKLCFSAIFNAMKYPCSTLLSQIGRWSGGLAQPELGGDDDVLFDEGIHLGDVPLPRLFDVIDEQLCGHSAHEINILF